jgi:AraC-like DNA-binding protein
MKQEMSELSFAASEIGANFAGLRPKYDDTVNQVENSEHRLMKDLRDLIATVSTAERDTWPHVIRAAKMAGVTDDDIRRELGASPSTVHRWLYDDVAPREGTRRLMKGALLGLLDSRLGDDAPAAPPTPLAAETRKRAGGRK